jgi:HEAT repeat protein
VPESVGVHEKGLKETQSNYVTRIHVDALAAIKTSAAVRALVRALGHEDDYVANYSANALGGIGKRAVPALIKALKHKNVNVAWYSARTLGEIKDPRAVPALIKALEHDDPGVLRHSAGALGEIKDPRATNGLIRTLQSNSSLLAKSARHLALERKYKNIVAYSAWALGEIGGNKALVALMALADHPHEGVRSAVKQAIRRIQGVKDA